MRALDGNAAGGLLYEIFGAELTAASTTCGGCGNHAAVGALAAYVHAPGTVLRCRACERVLLKIVRIEGRIWVDLSGMSVLELSG